MNQRDVDALDHQIDERADGDLITALARLRPADWPERAAAGRIAERVASAFAAGTAAPACPGRTTSRRRYSRARRVAATSTAGLLVAAGLAIVAVISSPDHAPIFQVRFRAEVLATTGATRVGRQNHQWQLASYLVTPGWHAHDLTDPPGSLSCPSAVTCYITATKPVSYRAMSHTASSYNILQVTHDAGSSWTAYGFPASLSFSTALQCPQTASVCVAGATDGRSAALLRTTDGGRSWSAQRLPFTPQVNDLACGSNLNCVGIFTRPNEPSPSYDVWYTRDGGRTWAPGPENQRGQLPDYLTCRGTRCVLFDQLIVHDNSKSVNGEGPLTFAPGIWQIWISDDGGRQWRRGAHPAGFWPLPSGGNPTSQAVSCPDTTHCAALVSTNWFYPNRPGRAAIMTTTDGGLHWSAHVIAPLADAGFDATVIACPTRQQCLVGAKGPRPAIAQTTDDGLTWTLPPLPRSVVHVRVNQVPATGLVPSIDLLACSAEQHCLAIVFADPNARRIPVLSLLG